MNEQKESVFPLEVFKGWDFVFLDDNHRPFRVRQFGEELWLHYWHPDKRWVTLRPLRTFEGPELKDRALPEDQAKLYEAGLPFH